MYPFKLDYIYQTAVQQDIQQSSTPTTRKASSFEEEDLAAKSTKY
jgi:hypothetical protein